MKRIETIVGIVIGLILFYFAYRIYKWFGSLITIPTQAAPGQTLAQTQQEYLAKIVPVPAPGDSNVSGLVTSDKLTLLDKLYLYLDTLNPWRSGGIFNSNSSNQAPPSGP